MDKISVLIPVYNAGKYLEKCIQSIIEQSYENLEIICINDASTDNSLEILHQFEKNDKRIKLIDNKINLGYGKSLNKGLNEATGKYISIVESDDYIAKDMLSTLYCEIIDNDTQISKGNFYEYRNKKIKKSAMFQYLDCNMLLNKENSPQILMLKPTVWSALYKKDFLNEFDIKFNTSEGASYQDTSFQFKCLYFAKKIKLIDKPLYFYRIDNPNSSINDSDKVFEIIEEFNKINEFFKTEEPDMIASKMLFELRAYLWNFKRIKNKYDIEFLKEISEVFKKYPYKFFIRSKKINLKDKLKLRLVLQNSYFSRFFLVLYKKLCNAKIL